MFGRVEFKQWCNETNDPYIEIFDFLNSTHFQPNGLQPELGYNPKYLTGLKLILLSWNPAWLAEFGLKSTTLPTTQKPSLRTKSWEICYLLLLEKQLYKIIFKNSLVFLYKEINVFLTSRSNNITVKISIRDPFY